MTYDTLAYIAETWGLLWLAGMFVAALTYACWPGNREKFRRASRMPLEDGADSPIDAGSANDRSSS